MFKTTHWAYTRARMSVIDKVAPTIGANVRDIWSFSVVSAFGTRISIETRVIVNKMGVT
jgi:hypothetical protein